MASIDLPRSLQDYFAFAETAPTRSGRRFSITLPYVRADGRLDRLQWWYHLSPAKEMALGEGALDLLRAEAVDRFGTHIERWLQNTRQDMFGDGAIPYVAAEGNRVVAAYRVNPEVSAGMSPSREEVADSVATRHAPEALEDGGAPAAEGDDPAASKTAFG